jgi:hypothetical protein
MLRRRGLEVLFRDAALDQADPRTGVTTAQVADAVADRLLDVRNLGVAYPDFVILGV